MRMAADPTTVARVFGWYETSRWRVLGGSFFAVVCGSMIVYGSILTSAIPAGGIGLLFVAIGIFPINDLVRYYSRRHPSMWLLIGGACIVVAAALMAAALAHGGPWLAVLAVVVGTLGFLAYGSLLRLFAQRQRLATTLTGLTATAIGIGLWLATQDQWPFALVLIALGVLAYRTGLPGWLKSDDAVRLAAKVGLAGLVLGVIGSAASAATGRLGQLALWAMFTILFLHLVSVAASSEHGRRWRLTNPRWRRWARPARVGAWLLVIATWIVLVTVGSQPLLIGTALAIALASLGAAFVWRGEFVLTALLLGFLVVWVSLDRTAPYEPTGEPTTGRIVALGDSYISGEGAKEFLPGTNIAGGASNECRRAPTAYPVLIAEALGKELDFVACSGAKAANLYLEGQMPTAPPMPFGRTPQLEAIDGQGEIDFVLVSIGGNDARFTAVAETCLLPGPCDELGNLWLEPTTSLASELVPAYEAIRARVGEATPIIAMPYPIMLTEQACADAMLTTSEHRFIVHLVQRINDQVQLAATQSGIHFFEAGIDALHGDRICDAEEVAPASVNFISLAPTSGPFLDRLNPNNWAHGSFHPNAAGHQRIAQAFLDWMDPNLQSKPIRNSTAVLQPSGQPVITAPTPLEGLPDVGSWRRARIVDAVRVTWRIPLLLFFGGWVGAITGRDGPFRRLDWSDLRQSSSAPDHGGR